MLSNDMGMGGGAEEQIIALTYALQSRGWKPMIVSLVPPSPMPADFAAHGIPLLHLGMSRGIPDPRSIYRLARIIGQFRPNVVHSHMPHAKLLSRLVRLIQPFPVQIGTLHAMNMAGVDRDHAVIYETAHCLTEPQTDCTTAICHAAAEHYVRVHAVRASKLKVIPHGINSAAYENNPAYRQRLRNELGLEDRFVWVAVGRLETVKAYPTLLRAFASLLDRSTTLLICGEGSLAAELRALATQLHIAERVKFLGLRRDIPEILSAADGFVLSSDSEGLPLVLLQAAAAGLPIVTTDVGGNSEAVVDGVNGFLSRAGDSESFAQAMKRVQNSPAADRAILGRAGVARVAANFELQRIVDRWEQLYSVVGVGKGPPFSRRF
jgi:glycosyltransferase involved in cell wall biosynthesis